MWNNYKTIQTQLVHQLYTEDHVWAQPFLKLNVGDSCVSAPCCSLEVEYP